MVGSVVGWVVGAVVVAAVEGIIYFDGVNWQRMDPTFASSGGSGVMDYIGNGANYSAKYIY